MGKYGGVDLGLSTGTININIPITENTSTNLKVSVSLSYSTNGFRVDELAGRVGVGWSFNAGGVITRTVFGSVDESSTRMALPANFPQMSRGLIDYMEAISSGEWNGPDGQPDVFSFNFNGYSGKFILDENLNPLLLNYSNLKIEKDFSSTDWNFKITGPDGVQYFFGGENARERTKKITAGAGCGRNITVFIPTAWYLKKIVHPNNDEIIFTYSTTAFTYSTGIQQAIYERDNSQQPSACAGFEVTPPLLNNTICENILQSEGVLLTEINSTVGEKITFTYADRSDGDDKLLTGINVYQPGQTTIFRSFTLNYQYGIATSFKNSFSTGNNKLTYWPFLLSLMEQNNDGTLSRKHSFVYKDINALPPRLSFAQDHFGFFNGKNNTTLIPVPSTLTWQSKLPLATANREVDPDFAKKGLLCSITYPTGGKDSIEYEANQIYQSVTTYPAQTSVNISATNLEYHGGAGTTNYSANAVVSYNQEVTLIGQCVSNSTTGGDPIHDQSTISLIDETNAVVFTKTIFPGQNFSEILALTSGHTYRVKINSNGDNVTGIGTLFYRSGNVTTQSVNVNTGGVRVARVLTYDNISNTPTIKKYLYYKLSTPGISSGGISYAPPQYEKYLSVLIPCMSGRETGDEGTTGMINCDVQTYSFYSMYSNTLNNIYVYSSAPITYSDVIESFGDNFENGGIEHKYLLNPDEPSYSLVGNTILLGGPLSSYAWRNSRELYQHTFKLQGSNYVPVKKVFFSYKEDSRINADFQSYFANKKYAIYCDNNPGTPHPMEQNAYDLAVYSNFRKWVYLDTLKTWNYDINGQSYVEEVEITEYGNVAHALPTKQTTYKSDGISSYVKTWYPQDIALTGTEETARLGLISKYMIAAVIQQQIFKGSTQLYSLKTGYNTFTNGLILPQTHSIQEMGFSLEERTKYFQYNSYGKILEQSKTNDAKQSYIWDYNSVYPIAQVTNSPVADIAHTSFEADSKGNWTYTGTPAADATAPTGKKAFTIVNSANNITKSGLSTTTTYIVSYWKKSGTVTVNGTTPTTGQTINGWTYYEHKVVNPSGGLITVSGTSGIIDELRLYPASAQMTTYTYEPLIGMTSQCNANNKIIYYEYDSFGRLKTIRDQDRNVLKTMDYQYQQSNNQ
ncbi:hypothetical protein DC498_22240 [Terrimonas sp.]|nr:hypothetical protein DC498_22240 [Terrimonas sp.]